MIKVIPFLAIALFACVQPKTDKHEKTQLQKFIEKFLLENSDWDKNQITRDDANKKLKIDLMAALDSGLLNDHPLKLKGIKALEGAGKGGVTTFVLQFDESKALYYKPDYQLHFDVLIPTDSLTAIGLTEGKNYTIEGKYLSLATPEEINILASKMLWNPQIELRDDHGPSFSLGVILYEAQKFTEVKKRYTK